MRKSCVYACVKWIIYPHPTGTQLDYMILLLANLERQNYILRLCWWHNITSPLYSWITILGVIIWLKKIWHYGQTLIWRSRFGAWAQHEILRDKLKQTFSNSTRNSVIKEYFLVSWIYSSAKDSFLNADNKSLFYSFKYLQCCTSEVNFTEPSM